MKRATVKQRLREVVIWGILIPQIEQVISLLFLLRCQEKYNTFFALEISVQRIRMITLRHWLVMFTLFEETLMR